MEINDVNVNVLALIAKILKLCDLEGCTIKGIKINDDFYKIILDDPNLNQVVQLSFFNNDGVVSPIYKEVIYKDNNISEIYNIINLEQFGDDTYVYMVSRSVIDNGNIILSINRYYEGDDKMPIVEKEIKNTKIVRKRSDD